MTDQPNFAYRADIDGLRAIAVLAVVLYHGGVPPFSGGFVGVDIFFVISGYLITAIIAKDLDARRFSFLAFYERRIRRLGPALLAMVAFVVAFTLLFKTPIETETFGESISFFGLLASNHFFAQERGYFDVPRDTFALLHTWSLAVEEQFYLAFPLLLAALTAWAPRRRVSVVAALAAASFAASAYLVVRATGDARYGVDEAFYFAPLRAWELAIGALLALSTLDAARLSARLRGGLAWLGLALTLGPIFLFDVSTPFPGLAALPPCLGAALLIFTGARGDTAVARGLGWRPAVFVGLTSYSFYLWHWPLLSFATYAAMRPLSVVEASIVIAVSFLVSVGSLYLIERPFRRPGGVLARRPIFIAAGGALAACVLLGALLQKTNGLPQRYSDAVLALSTGDSHEFGVELADCDNQSARLSEDARRDIQVMFCAAGARGETPTELLWGDSHTLSISPAFADAAAARGRSILVTSRAACPPVVNYDWKPLQTWRGCSDHNRAVFASLERLGVTRVYLFAAWGAYANEVGDAPTAESVARFEAALDAMLADLAARGVEVVIGGSVPTHEPFHIPSVMHRAHVLGVTPPIDLTRATHEQRQDPEKTILQRVAARHGAVYFALDERFCDAATCVYQRDGLPLYADHGHVNLRGARALVGDIGALMDASAAPPQ